MSMSELTPERLAEIKARAEKATPGPWTATYEESDQWTSITGAGLFDGGHWMVCPEVATTEGEPGEDSDFIAHAREDVPDLLAEVERLRATSKPRNMALHYAALRNAEAWRDSAEASLQRVTFNRDELREKLAGARAERDALQAKLDQVRAWSEERSMLTASGKLVSGVPGLSAILDGKEQDA